MLWEGPREHQGGFELTTRGPRHKVVSEPIRPLQLPLSLLLFCCLVLSATSKHCFLHGKTCESATFSGHGGRKELTEEPDYHINLYCKNRNFRVATSAAQRAAMKVNLEFPN